MLLSDEHLEEPVRVDLGEVLGMGGVADLGVQGDHRWPRAERGERLAVCLPGGDLRAERVDRQLNSDRRGLRRPPDGRRRHRPPHAQVAFATECGDRALGHIGRQGLAVPSVGIDDLRKTLPLASAGEHDHRPVGFGGLGQDLVNRGDVMPVDGERLAAERLSPAGVGIKIPAELGRTALAETVDIHDRCQIRQLVVGRLVQGLPDRALSHLAVATQHPHPIGEPVKKPAGECHPDRVRQALPERAGCHVNPWQDRRRMALQAVTETAISGHQLVIGDHADGLEHRVQQRGRVPLGEDQVIVGRIVRLVPVIPQVSAEQNRHHIRG